MNQTIQLFEQWILKRDKRERIVLFLISLTIIYYVFNLIFIRPVVTAENALNAQIEALVSQRKTIQQELVAVHKIVTSPEFLRLLNQKQLLLLQTKNIKQKIVTFEPIFVAEKDYSRLTKDILMQLNKSITLISLKEYPNQPWTISDIDKTNIFIKNIDQHKLSLEFRANYFDTIAFLARLEKLPWHLYWDSLEYKVVKYPEADVVVQLYVLSRLQSA